MFRPTRQIVAFMENQQALLTAKQVAERLGYSVANVHDLLARGTLVGIDIALSPKHRRCWRVSRTELDRFQERRANRKSPVDRRRSRDAHAEAPHRIYLTKEEARTLLKPQQVADRLSCTLSHVHQMLATKTLLGTDIALNGKKRPCWRISEEELERFLTARTSQPPAPKRRVVRKYDGPRYV